MDFPYKSIRLNMHNTLNLSRTDGGAVVVFLSQKRNVQPMEHLCEI